MSKDRRDCSSQDIHVPAKRVAVVVPLSKRATLSVEEQISLRHLQHHLGRYDIYLIRPTSVRIKLGGLHEKVFPDQFFGSQQAYTRLLLSRHFYESFADYEFILIYHLDALVFSDQLERWCNAGYDYIGPPWFKSKNAPEAGFSLVGNGGFSLRRIASILRVMDSPKNAMDPREYWLKYFADQPWHIQLFNVPRWLLKHLHRFNSAQRELAQFWLNDQFGEDHFWSYRATHFYPEFKIAPPQVALQFAFQDAPRYCYALNNCELPFGCHAWPKMDRQFWEPFLLH